MLSKKWNQLPIETEVNCSDVIKIENALRTNQMVNFFCEGYSNEGDICKDYSLISTNYLLITTIRKQRTSLINQGDVCGASMHGYIIDDHRKLYICSKSPICSGTKLKKENL